MNIVFAGTSDIAVPTLKALAKISHIVAIITAPDRQAGRGLSLIHSPVKSAALSLGITKIYQPESLKKNARDYIRSLEFEPDLLVIFSYGKILGPKFLSLFPKGAINIHPSALPKYRGPSPLISSILNCDDEYSISIQKVALEVDAGDILAVKTFSLTHKETHEELCASASTECALFLTEMWPKIDFLLNNATPQKNFEISYCHKIAKEDGEINFKEEGHLINAKIRAFQPWPKTWTYWHGRQLNFYSAEFESLPSDNEQIANVPVGTVLKNDSKKGLAIICKCGILWVTELQLQNKKRLDWVTFYNGNRDIVGSILGG